MAGATPVGALAALLVYNKSEKGKVLKAILAGLTVRQILRVLSRSLIGLKREPEPIDVWVGQYDEDAVEADIAIFDPHHHMWDFRVQDKGLPLPKWMFTWLNPATLQWLFSLDKAVPNSFGARIPLITRFMGEELLRDIRRAKPGAHNVVGTMYMECGWKTPGVPECMQPVGEAAMVTQVNKDFYGVCQGMVCAADLRLGAAVEPALKAYKENPLVKGIRFGLAWNANKDIVSNSHANVPNVSREAKFREGFALLEKYGFSFDSWHYHENNEDFTLLARAFPGTTMILDHLGFPLGISVYNRETVLPQWKDQMADMARCQNVFVKIGGLGMRFFGFGFDEKDKPPTSDELAKAWGPYVLYTIETFGVDRCMMESNFPMDKISCSYTVLFNALKKTVSGFSKEDKRKLFELNAKRIYRI